MKELYELRKSLHQNPELAFEEHQTAAILMEFLKQQLQRHPQHASKFKIHRFKNSLGILIEYSQGSGGYRLFRADMDALPISEDTGCDFASLNPGRMHACGHDVHMTVLMGLICKCLEHAPQRNLLFLFQPAEEGKGGAMSILEEGVIQGYEIEAVIALHIASDMPVGTVSSREGVFFGIPQEFDVKFSGKSAHVAFPEKGKDAIASAISFAQMMRRDIDQLAKEQRVIYHIGKIEGGSIRNVIAESCTLEGTHRSINRESRDRMNQLTLENAREAAALTDSTFVVNFLCSYDAVINDANLVEQLKNACEAVEVIYQEAEIAMTGEDFGFYTTLYPGLLFWLGSDSPHPLHSPRFLPSFKSIDVGVKLMWQLAQS